MVKVLGIAVEDEAIALRRGRRIPQVGEIRVHQVHAVARNRRRIVWGRRAGDDTHRVTKAIIELESVEVTQQDDVLGGIRGLARLHQIWRGLPPAFVA